LNIDIKKSSQISKSEDAEKIYLGRSAKESTSFPAAVLTASGSKGMGTLPRLSMPIVNIHAPLATLCIIFLASFAKIII